MFTDHPTSKNHDASDSIPSINSGSGGIDSGLSNPNFNCEYVLASQRPGTALLPDFSLDNIGRTSVSDNNRQPADATIGTIGAKFKNIDASPQFLKQTQEAFQESFGRLNPETQEKLKDLKVVTASQASKGLPGVPKDTPAVTPDLREKRGNMMVFSEVGIKKDHAPIKDVMNHEIWHAVDNATKASNDPELRKAIDAGIKRLPRREQHEIAVRGKEQVDERYAEFSGDVMALEVGSKPKDLAYVTHLTDPYNNFKEARELIRKRYLM